MTKLTVEEIKKIAMRNYNNGGDAIIECYEDKDIQELIDHGLTLQGLLSMFSIREEEFKAATYFSGSGFEDGVDGVEDEDRVEAEEEKYISSSINFDYSPSCPWNAPGMSPSDFIR